jgi:hypothetical protein
MDGSEGVTLILLCLVYAGTSGKAIVCRIIGVDDGFAGMSEIGMCLAPIACVIRVFR